MDDLTLDWDDANIGHIAKHDVMPEEVEEVVLGDPVNAGFEVVDGEDRWTYVGETALARILRIVVTVRGERIRAKTAYEAPKYWTAFFLEQKAGQQ